ncbi:hypothetical protein BDB01DRAFT_900757 [Pilobolus umbonatus]|nr:hypothetical protein BDB01DRAFT_900755 [Pilobolus umbonatus]KAI8971117.1 hypothetical protein BDB01DRAFT_900756 [Pilobolus umbonatus]KAI8971118.1 hypothetical protein BDB01DRAFT_900757 [Pilobolus umbonatus]
METVIPFWDTVVSVFLYEALLFSTFLLIELRDRAASYNQKDSSDSNLYIIDITMAVVSSCTCSQGNTSYSVRNIAVYTRSSQWYTAYKIRVSSIGYRLTVASWMVLNVYCLTF